MPSQRHIHYTDRQHAVVNEQKLTESVLKQRHHHEYGCVLLDDTSLAWNLEV